MNGTWDEGDEHVFDLYAGGRHGGAFAQSYRAVRVLAKLVAGSHLGWMRTRIERVELRSTDAAGKGRYRYLSLIATLDEHQPEEARDVAVAWITREMLLGTITEHR